MIAGYRLRINGGSFTDYEIDVGYVFEHLPEDLAPGTTYSVQIQSYDEDGVESLWSSSVSATTATATMLVDGSGNALIDSSGNALIIYV